MEYASNSSVDIPRDPMCCCCFFNEVLGHISSMYIFLPYFQTLLAVECLHINSWDKTTIYKADESRTAVANAEQGAQAAESPSLHLTQCREYPV